MSEFEAASIRFGSDNIYLILIDDVPYGWTPLDKAADIFGRLVGDRKVQLEQDLGHSVTESAFSDENGGCTVVFASWTRSYIWSGMRTRCKLQLKKIAVVKTLS